MPIFKVKHKAKILLSDTFSQLKNIKKKFTCILVITPVVDAHILPDLASNEVILV